MTHGTHPSQADEALRQARESQIVNEPATVEACQADYAEAQDPGQQAAARDQLAVTRAHGNEQAGAS